MSYKLKILPIALKEWKKLDNNIRSQFKKKINERLENPRIISSRLRNFKDHYKIKLKTSGYRLVYEVIDKEVFILIIAVGHREDNNVYKKAKKRIIEN